VVEVYEQLVAEGYLSAARGSATRVAPRSARRDVRRAASPTRAAVIPTPPPMRFDFRPGVPDMSLFPRRAWLRALRSALETDASALDYPDPQGADQTRAALAAYLNRSRATVADADRIVLCTGFAQAARLVGEVLRATGVRRIAVEDPGHAEQCADLRAAGLELVSVPVDDRGLRTDLLAKVHVGAVLVTPAHQYPTGVVLSAERRSALLEWATSRSAFVIEDDYDAEYRYDREPIGALQGLAPHRVVYIGTASKVLAPALRQGWLVLPPGLVDDVARAKMSADRGSPALEQLALARFLEAGELDRHLRRTRAIYRRRRDVLVGALERYLPRLTIRGVAAGLHLLAELPRRVDESRLVAAAASHGIRVYGARGYHADATTAPSAVLMGYGGIEEDAIEGGVRALAALAHSVR
jgi:GntR family transcriptional regulator/MocR family aminotransferase